MGDDIFRNNVTLRKKQNNDDEQSGLFLKTVL